MTTPNLTDAERDTRARYDAAQVPIEHERMKGAHLNGRDAMLRLYEKNADARYAEMRTAILTSRDTAWRAAYPEQGTNPEY